VSRGVERRAGLPRAMEGSSRVAAANDDLPDIAGLHRLEAFVKIPSLERRQPFAAAPPPVAAPKSYLHG
jgi:hypothetical protein